MTKLAIQLLRGTAIFLFTLAALLATGLILPIENSFTDIFLLNILAFVQLIYAHQSEQSLATPKD
jgi:hypothetical protein